MAKETAQETGDVQQGDPARPWKVATAVLAVLAVAGIAVFSQQGQRTAQPAATATVTVTAAPGDPAAPADPTAAGQTTTSQGQQEALLSLPRRQEGDPMAKGRVDAPVVMTEWADYRCPFCSVFGEETLPKLQPLIDDGTLRVEFRDFAIFGDDSVNAAAAARAAGQQGLFWEFQLALYEALPNQGHPPVGDDLVMQIAQQVGVADMARFEADYRSEETRQAVRADSAEAQQLGVSSTPTFVVGGQVVSGAQPIEVFQQVIEQERAR
ncbi:disulfide bond formation protein [Arachnia propionica]|uniref:Disulfide bond formation protein n=1 Tax=Arachnia propionica TaxID=1750 RepID=A0A3P1TAX2_9ACTN|nr:thioredoxin domain-containing protein [Arachnia propionica]MDO5082030.1 thioredoxin domain-containing protein [Arachnia propionica]RRD06582.1 disulfide bond formation protein [Arachnia propionica]